VRTGVLLINLGTPDSPSVRDVRRYLREFLSDPRVVDIHPIGRWLLLHLIILPFRPKRSAAAYRKIWTEQGSPLLVEGKKLTDLLEAELGESFVVRLAMRYQSPSIRAAFDGLVAAGVDKIVVVPLFPQYSSAATGSALDRVYAIAADRWNIPTLETVGPFYDDPGFVAAFAAVAKPVLDDFDPDFVLFSYHGLPVRQIHKGDPTGTFCLRDGCCDRIVSENRYCYRAQCHATTRALAAALALPPDRHGLSFQSRLGRDPWIEPYTDRVLPKLRAEGRKRLAILSPAFVADCLETLEELGMGAKEQWAHLGGEGMVLVPSLNGHPAWVSALASMVRKRA
jgi:ferrochelatase